MYMPSFSLLGDGDWALLARVAGVAERAATLAEAGPPGAHEDLAAAARDLARAVRQVRDSFGSHAAAYLAGRKDQLDADCAAGAARLRPLPPVPPPDEPGLRVVR